MCTYNTRSSHTDNNDSEEVLLTFVNLFPRFAVVKSHKNMLSSKRGFQAHACITIETTKSNQHAMEKQKT